MHRLLGTNRRAVLEDTALANGYLPRLRSRPGPTRRSSSSTAAPYAIPG